MLIPQYSIRWLLVITAVCAGLFSIVGLAVRGQSWAIGVSVALGALVLTMLVYAAVFGLVWLASVLLAAMGRRNAGPGRSPFKQQAAGGGAPPRDGETPDAPILLE